MNDDGDAPVLGQLKSLRRGARVLVRNYVLRSRLFDPFRIGRLVHVEEVAGKSIRNLREVWPAREVEWGSRSASDGRFLGICKYFNRGGFRRDPIFVCEVPGAYCHVRTGLVCTEDLEVIAESEMEYRIDEWKVLRWPKPLRARRIRGACATVQNLFAFQWWHWMIDCLPRLLTLREAYPGEKIVILAPGSMGATFKESLESVLPPEFELRYLPPDSWVRADRMLLASYASGISNGHLPEEHLEFLRRSVFARFGLPQAHDRVERIYLKRPGQSYRRTVNEPELLELMTRYGFRIVSPEALSFRQQVELFHRAAVVVGTHGSAWTNILFSGRIKLLVLYPDKAPNTHIFTMAKALDQEHHFVAHPGEGEHWSFSADLAAVEHILRDEMGLTCEPDPASLS